MEAARTSETLVNFYQTTRCYNPEDSHLHTHRRENLKSYLTQKTAIFILTAVRTSNPVVMNCSTFQNLHEETKKTQRIFHSG
jgi:hypothetical protein